MSFSLAKTFNTAPQFRQDAGERKNMSPSCPVLLSETTYLHVFAPCKAVLCAVVLEGRRQVQRAPRCDGALQAVKERGNVVQTLVSTCRGQALGVLVGLKLFSGRDIAENLSLYI